jgi:hypothetical protein
MASILGGSNREGSRAFFLGTGNESGVVVDERVSQVTVQRNEGVLDRRNDPLQLVLRFVHLGQYIMSITSGMLM